MANAIPAEQIKLIVFDLDGTLIDSRRDLATAVNAMLGEMGRPALPDKVVAEETGSGLNRAIVDGHARGIGMGEAVGAYLLASAPRHQNLSVTAAAARLGIPLTVHVAIGTDIIHMHPEASGAAIGATSLRDFRRFVSNVARLAGGAYLNCGSRSSCRRSS